MDVSSRAASLIRRLLSEDTTATGLRLAQRDDHPAMHMQLTAGPSPEDQVVVRDGTPVYLGPMAAVLTRDSLLDADEAASALFLRGPAER